MKNIQKKTKTHLLKAITVSTLKITVAGIGIGYFHQHDLAIAIVLAIYTALTFYRKALKPKNWLLLWGMILTGILGLLAESWGVYYQYWEYHDLTDNRQLPYWLLFAWMLAFKAVYDLESQLIALLNIKNLLHKTIIAILVTAIFPAFGEVITIYLGVWTYSWPYQILGVPLYAIICLVVLHMFVNIILVIAAKKYQIKNDVFTISE